MLRSLQTCFSLADNAIATDRFDQTNRVHISSFAVGENTELVPTGGMPLKRSVGKATRHTIATVTVPLPAIRCQTCRARQAGLTVRLLRSEQRVDTRLSNALADSKHALQNMPGWPLGFSGRSEQRSETYFHNSYHAGASDPLPNMSCKTSRADRSPSLVWATRWHSLEQRSSWLQTCPSKHAGLTAIGFSGRSEQRSDTRLSNALADQSSCTVPVDIPLPAVRF